MLNWYKKNCSEGSVCAWEYGGKLYKTREQRDRAEKADQEIKAREAFVKRIYPLLMDKVSKKLFYSFQDCHHIAAERIAKDLAIILCEYLGER